MTRDLADVVFDGIVLDVQSVRAGEVVTLEVVQVWKGDVSKRFTIHNARPVSNIDSRTRGVSGFMQFEKGQRYDEQRSGEVRSGALLVLLNADEQCARLLMASVLLPTARPGDETRETGADEQQRRRFGYRYDRNDDVILDPHVARKGGRVSRGIKVYDVEATIQAE